MKEIAILGSTGSIGTQALDVISRNPHLFNAKVLIAGNNVDLLVEQARRFRPRLAVIANDSKFSQLKRGLSGLGIECASGEEAVIEACTLPAVDTVLSAAVGYSGLIPTVHAVKAGKQIALANKESLVVAGKIVMEECRKNNVEILPVDSEHSAIYQCLKGEEGKKVARLIITASGGPFRKTPLKRLKEITAADALKHPNWSMGAKITIDSATMMNKAFEIIEARWLFDIERERISPVVHPQSVVHSMVEFVDGSVKAQLGVPDMRMPIRYALADGCRIDAPSSEQRLDLTKTGKLTFEEPDYKKFPCLSLAETALGRGGNSACVINAANEIAVDAFLHDKIRFTDIYPVIVDTLEKTIFIEHPSLGDLIQTNKDARAEATKQIKKHHNWKHSL